MSARVLELSEVSATPKKEMDKTLKNEYLHGCLYASDEFSCLKFL